MLHVFFIDPSAELDNLQIRMTQFCDHIPQTFGKNSMTNGDDVLVFDQVKFFFYGRPVFIFCWFYRPKLRVDAGVKKIRFCAVDLFDSLACVFRITTDFPSLGSEVHEFFISSSLFCQKEAPCEQEHN